MPRKKIRLSTQESAAIPPSPSPSSEPIENASAAAPSSASAAPPFEEQETRGRGPGKPRLVITLTEEGEPDLAQCKAEMIAKLRAMMVDPKVREQLGIAGLNPDTVISEEDIGQLLDLVGAVEGGIFGWLGKIDADIAHRWAAWTPEQKAMIAPPAKRVIAKHAAALMWFLQWRDEVALAMLFITITRAKFQMAKVEMQMRRDGTHPAQQPAPQPEPGPAPGQEFLAPTKPVN